jgi:hypothetical protein
MLIAGPAAAMSRVVALEKFKMVLAFSALMALLLNWPPSS